MSNYLQNLIKKSREEGREVGVAEGVAEGRREGEGRLARLMSFLLQNGKTQEALAATEDEVKRHEFYAKYGIA